MFHVRCNSVRTDDLEQNTLHKHSKGVQMYASLTYETSVWKLSHFAKYASNQGPCPTQDWHRPRHPLGADMVRTRGRIRPTKYIKQMSSLIKSWSNWYYCRVC